MINLENLLENIQLPEIYERDGKRCFLDPFREKLIFITPEEIIRQKIASVLIDTFDVPKEMIKIEFPLKCYGINSGNRADIIIHRIIDDDTFCPLAVVECKADHLMIGDKAVDQVVGYACDLGCDYFFLTNGVDLIVAKFDEASNRYIQLNEIPNYKSMLDGRGEALPESMPPERIAFDQLEDFKDVYIGDVIGESTPSKLVAFLTDFEECLLDESHKMPSQQFKVFNLIRDYGVRLLDYGNASGGQFQGAYRSFLIDYKGSTEFVGIGLSSYSTSGNPDNIRTIICVAIDDEKTSHHSLQLVVDDQLFRNDNTYIFTHSGRITVGNSGGGKISELKKLIEQQYPEILIDDKIMLGSIDHNKPLYLDDHSVIKIIENLISYALVRDDYRTIIKKRQK